MIHRTRQFLCFAAPLLLLLLLLWPALISGTAVSRHDTLKHFPFFAYYVHNFSFSGPPLWSPFTHSGEPFFPYVLPNGLLKPDIPFFVLAHKLVPSIPLLRLFHWEVFVSLAFFLAGAFLFLSKLGKTAISALAAYCGLALGGISLCAWIQLYGSLDNILFLPWILFFAQGFVREGKKTFLAGACACLGAAVCCYIPVYLYAYLGFLALGFYAERRLAGPAPSADAERRFLLSWPHIAGGAAIFAACALPGLAVFLESRALFPIARVFSGSYIPQSGLLLPATLENQGVPSYLRDLASGWLPLAVTMKASSELPLYLTFPVFSLALLGAVMGRGKGRLAFAVAGVLSFWAALGARAGFSTLLGLIPGFTAARHMEMFMPFVIFSLSALAVYGFDYVAENYENLRSAFLKRRGWLSLLMVTGYWFSGVVFRWPQRHAPLMCLFYGGAAVLLLNALFLRRGKAAFALLLCFIAGDAGFNHLSSKWRFFGQTPQVLASYRPPQLAYNPYRSWTVPFLADLSPLYGEPSCFSAGEPFLLYEDSAFFPDNLRFFISSRYYAWLRKLNVVSFYENRKPPAADWEKRLGITSPKAFLIGGGAVSPKAYAPGRAVFETSSDAPREFAYLDGWHKGWRAFVDGQQEEIRVHDSVFKKVPVPAGRHVVRFEFSSPLFSWGALLSYAVLCIVFLWVFVPGFTKGKNAL